MAWDTLTLENIRLEIREELGEDDTETDPLWSNTYLNKWINDYARLVAEATEAIEKKDDFATVIGKVNYDMPGNIFKPTLLKRGNTTVINPIDLSKLKTIDTSQTGTPTRYLVFNKQLYLYLIPSSIETINIWGYAYPDYMEDNNDTLSLDRDLIIIIEKLVIARAQRVDQQYGVANQYNAQVPFDISDYLFKRSGDQQQRNPQTVDVMGYQAGDYGNDWRRIY